MLEDRTDIDRSVPIPLYYQLKERILSEIRQGHYASGDAIPTEKEISAMFQLSRTTVRQAIAELVQEGWLYRVKSKGTFVGHPKIPQNFIRKVESYNNTILRLGMIPSTEVLQMTTLSVRETDRAAVQALQLNDGDRVIFLERLRFADQVPNVIARTYLPDALCHFLLDHDFNSEQLYPLLAVSDRTRIFRIERVVEAVAATATDASLLQIRKGAPVQFFTSVGYNTYGDPVEYTLSRYRGDRNSFEVTVFPEE